MYAHSCTLAPLMSLEPSTWPESMPSPASSASALLFAIATGMSVLSARTVCVYAPWSAAPPSRSTSSCMSSPEHILIRSWKVTWLGLGLG